MNKASGGDEIPVELFQVLKDDAMKVQSESEVPQSCPTLSNPMNHSPPGSSIHGIFQAGVLEWVAIAFSDTIIQFLITLKDPKCDQYTGNSNRGSVLT